MRIKKLIIYGYGKWVDTEFDLDSQLQVFYGQNEAGKSTLMSFIQSILFGFPMRHSSSLRYEPKESSRYGGKLIVYDKRFGEVSIERVSGKVTGNVTVTLEDGTQGDERLLDTLLNHKKRHFYESIYSFNLKGVEETSEMKRDQFNRFFLSVGSFGNENFLKKADNYHQKASQLYKPTGRKPELNQLFQTLEKQKIKLDSAKESNEEYILLVKKKETILSQIKEMENRFKETNKEIDRLHHLLKNVEKISEINELKMEIARFSSITLPDDGLIHLNHINHQLKDLREQTKGLYDQQKEIQEKYRPSKDLLIYQAHEEAVSKLLNNWDQLELTVELLKESQQELSLLEKQLFEFKLREGLPLNESLPKKLTENEKNSLLQYAKDNSSLENEQAELNEKLNVLKLKIENNDERIDSIERSLWTAARFKEVEEQENEISPATANKPKLTSSPVFIYSGGSLLIALAYLILQSPIVLYFIPIYVVLVTVLINTKSNKTDLDSSSFDRSKFYHQKSLRGQWKEALASNDDLQQKINEYKNLLQTNRVNQKAIDEEFLKWKAENMYPASYGIESVLASMDQLEELRKIDELKKNEQSKVTRQMTTLNQFLKQNDYTQLFLEKDKDTLTVFSEVRRSIRQIENDKRMQQSYIKETEKLQNTILYYVQQEKEQMKLKNELTEKAGVDSEEEFVKAYQRMTEKNEKISRYEMLKETINIDHGDNDTHSIEGLNQKVEELETIITQTKEQQTELTKRSIELDYKISELEEGGTYSDLLQKFENEKSRYQEVADEWSTYKIAAALIENTLNNAKENQLPQTIKLAEKYFSYITSNEYISISLEADQFFVSDKKGGKWQASELSRGTVEPLYIAIRLAFVVNNKDNVDFPVIIDDSFVNIDESRKSNIYELLNQISHSIQVIYFTFDETTLDYINSQYVIKLDYIK